MIEPERPACAALISYMHGDDDLLSQLRMMWEWKDQELRRLVEIAMRCLEEIESDDMINRSVVYFFCSYLPSLETLMQHPDLIKFNRADRGEQAAKAYFGLLRNTTRDHPQAHEMDAQRQVPLSAHRLRPSRVEVSAVMLEAHDEAARDRLRRRRRSSCGR